MHMFVNKNTATPQNGHQLWEYILVAYPDEAVRQLVEEERALLPQAYRSGMRPHITIAGFQAKEEMEETLVRWIQNICRLHSAFDITLNNFSGQPPHTIYLRIQDAQPLVQLAQRLRILDGFVQSNDCPPVRLNGRPYLAIGSLPEAAYAPALTEFAQRSFHASFRVDKIVLVRRWWEGGSYELVDTFNLPAS